MRARDWRDASSAAGRNVGDIPIPRDREEEDTISNSYSRYILGAHPLHIADNDRIGYQFGNNKSCREETRDQVFLGLLVTSPQQYCTGLEPSGEMRAKLSTYFTT